MSISKHKEVSYHFGDLVETKDGARGFIAFEQDTGVYVMYYDVLSCINEKKLMMATADQLSLVLTMNNTTREAEVLKWYNTLSLNVKMGENPFTMRVMEEQYKHLSDENRDSFALYLWEVVEAKQAIRKMIQETVISYTHLIDNIRLTL